MKSGHDTLISKFVTHLSAIEGVRALALVGSRGSRDSSRIDQYSDADFLIICDEETRQYLIKNQWIETVAMPLLVFPQIMEDEIRILYTGLFASELHILTTSQAEKLSGPCKLGSYLNAGFTVQYDPSGILADLFARIEPERPGVRSPEISSSVFWYNAAYCANLIARGDLFRASRFSNWYLQLFLLDLIFDIDEHGATKYISRRLHPDQYEALTATISQLDKESMIAGLKRCMTCYWKFQKEKAPEIDSSLLVTYRRIESEVLQLLNTA